MAATIRNVKMKYVTLIICAAICNAASVQKDNTTRPKVQLRVSPANIESATVLPFDSEVALHFQWVLP